VISWVSTTVVVITAVGSLSPFLVNMHPMIEVVLQIILLITIMLLNLKGVQTAGKVEFILILMKFIPLIIIPFSALFYFDTRNFGVSDEISSLTISSILSQVTLLTFFGFIGLECATTAAGEVYNPSKTIPRAIITGTLCVAFLYFLNSISIMGLMPGIKLISSKAPYVDASRIVFGGNWYLLIACIASIVCVGTLNAWILASGQIILGLAQDGLMPKFFTKQNKHGAPFLGILASCLGIIPLLILTFDKNFSCSNKYYNRFFCYSISIYLFIFVLFAFLKLKNSRKKIYLFSIYQQDDSDMTYILQQVYPAMILLN
jgi:APA family basic amino acid/polyamine antiporter